MPVEALVTLENLQRIVLINDLAEGRDYGRTPAGDIRLTYTGLRSALSRLGVYMTAALDGASLTGVTLPTYGGVDRESLSSVALVRNAKGGVQPEVKVYDASPDQAKVRAVEIFDALATKYPHINAGTPAKGE